MPLTRNFTKLVKEFRRDLFKNMADLPNELQQEQPQHTSGQDVKLDLDRPFDESTATPIAEQPEDVKVEEKTENTPATFVSHGKVDPNFNCQQCEGEGMLFTPSAPEGVTCPTCKGTGKVA